MTATGARKLLRHGSVYAATSLASAALALVVLPIYVAFLGPEGLGQVELLATGSALLTLLVGQGLPGAWFRLRFDHEGSERARFEAVVVWYVLGLSVATVAALSVVGPALSERFTPNVPFYPLWLMAAIAGCAAILGDIYAAGLQAEQRSRSYAVFTLGRRMLTIGAIVVLVAAMKKGVPGKLVAEAVASLLVAGSVVVFVRPSLPGPGSGSLLHGAVMYGLPLLPHVLAMQVIAMSDRFVLSHYLGLGAVGVYSLGYRVASVVEMANVGLTGAYRGLFMNRAAAAQRGTNDPSASTPESLARAELSLLAASGVLAQTVAVFGRELLWLVRVDQVAFAQSWRVTCVVCAGMLAHASYSILVTPILHSKAAVSRVPAISAAGALVNLIGCVALVPRFGMLAAAWATVASHTTIALGAFFVGRRVGPGPESLRGWWKVFAAVLATIGAGYACDTGLSGALPRVGVKVVLVVAGAFVVLAAADFSPRLLARAALRRLVER